MCMSLHLVATCVYMIIRVYACLHQGVYVYIYMNLHEFRQVCICMCEHNIPTVYSVITVRWYAPMHTHVHPHTVIIYALNCTYTYLHSCTCRYALIFMHTCIQYYIPVYTHVNLCKPMYSCMYMYTYVYSVYIHVYSQVALMFYAGLM